MNELFVTARDIREIIARGHPARQVFTKRLSFRAQGDEIGKSTRQIEVTSPKFNPDAVRLEEIGYMAGGIPAPWLKPVILPIGAEEVKLERKQIADPETGKLTIANSIIGLPRGAWMGICIEVQERLGQTYLEKQKGKYRNWLETGRQPTYTEDPTKNIIDTRVEAAWKPLGPEQEEVLGQGLVALLRCLREQPEKYILELPLHSKGTVG